MQTGKNVSVLVAIVFVVSIVAFGAYVQHFGELPKSTIGPAIVNANAQATGPDLRTGDLLSLNLSDKQLESVKVEPASEREFPVEKEAVGSIDFNQDMTVQVFTPYQGRIVDLGEEPFVNSSADFGHFVAEYTGT